MKTDTTSSWIWLATGIFGLAALWVVWAFVRPDLTIQLGSIGGFSSGHLRFLQIWVPLGALVAVLLAKGLQPGAKRIGVALARGSDVPWLVGLAVAALAGGIVCHTLILQGMPVTDDESAYLFAAQLILDGTVAAPEPADKLFWDRAFMMNDRTFYPQYFLGWPALLAPFEALGLPGLANPFWFSLSVPAWFLILRRASDSAWARAGTLAFVLSPMALLGSGTLMAHTSELCLLTWATWAGLRAIDEDGRWWAGGLLGLCFSGAFFNRPVTALSLGLPILLLFGWHAVRRRRFGAIAAFAVPSLALAGLFLGVNQWQNGSPTAVAYQKVLQYAVSNGYRFSHLPEGTVLPAVANFHLGNPVQQVQMLIVGVSRLTIAAWGWPFALVLFAFLPWRRRAVRIHGAAAALFCVVHLSVSAPGVDTFGPAHYFELMLPLTVLLVALAHDRTTRDEGVFGLHMWPLWVAGMLLSVCFYSPLRMLTAHTITTSVRRAFDATRDLGPAIVYVPLGGWAPQCEEGEPHYFLFWRPNPRPDFSDDVLYANHLSVAEDRAHWKRHYSDRAGYALTMVDGCELRAVDLSSPTADGIEDGLQTVPMAEED